MSIHFPTSLLNFVMLNWICLPPFVFKKSRTFPSYSLRFIITTVFPLSALLTYRLSDLNFFCNDLDEIYYWRKLMRERKIYEIYLDVMKIIFETLLFIHY